MRRCTYDPTRLVRCLTCVTKCEGFIDWYRANKALYVGMVDDYVDRFPEKYTKEMTIMARKKSDASQKGTKQKMIIAISQDGSYKIYTRDQLKDPKFIDEARECTMYELTGKQFDVIVSIELKARPLVIPKATARAVK